MAARRGRAGRPAAVEAVRRRIEHWRRTRARRTAMPEELWEASVSAAQVHGLWAVSRALRVNYESLKNRLHRSARTRHRRRAAPAGFVEVDTAGLVKSSERAGTVVELLGADGAKLTVRLEGREAVDVPALVDAFWRRGA